MMNSTNGRRLTSVTAGADYVLATDEAGDLWGYGNNNNGQLGVGYVNGSSVVLPLKAKLPGGAISALDPVSAHCPAAFPNDLSNEILHES
jgi:alpha-tubulin suppressor-like RCC1 family protein